MKLKKKGKK